MSNELLDRIIRDSCVPDLLTVLAQRLSPSDLQSLLLEVYRQRAAHRVPATLLADYQHNRFVRPSQTKPLALLDFDQRAFGLANPRFEPLELAPACPLGTTSIVAPVDQNSAVATIRNTECVSDSTNVLALECAVRRRALLRVPAHRHARVRLCASHRLLRAQNYNRPNALAHFRLFALCTAGRDEGNDRFECEALAEQLAFYVQLLLDLGQQMDSVRAMRVTLTDFRDTRHQRLQTEVLEPLASRFADVRFEHDPNRTAGRDYYDGLCFHVYATDPQGREHELVDGGLTRWTQQLLSNNKERLLISGIGSERVCGFFYASDHRG